MFMIPMGRLADIHGMRRIFFPGFVIFTIATLLCALSDSTSMLIAFRLVQGIGSAMIFSTAVAALTAVYPPGERGRVLGINVASVYIGLAMGPVLGGVLTHAFGWRSIFLSVIPISAVVILLLLRNREEWTERNPDHFDLYGSVLYGLMLLSLMYGLSVLPETAGWGYILFGIFMLALFIRREMRVESPVLQVRLFLENHVFAFSNLAALINYSATFAVTFLLSLYLQYNRGLDPQAAGLILVAQPFVQAVLSPAAGRISDRIEPGIVASAGMGVTVIGLVMLALLTEETPLVFIVGALALLGLGFALFSSPNTNAIMSSVERRYLGIASATLGTSRQVGMMLSMGIAMMIFSVIIGRVQITPAYHAQLLSSVQIAFALFAALCVAGIYFSLARGRVRREEG
jgi:MFS family permease